jgi:hypothetical protein
MKIFGLKSSIILCKLAQIFCAGSKIILNFVILAATKKGKTTNFFHPSLLFLFLDPGSGMDKNQDPGSGINIPDPQR